MVQNITHFDPNWAFSDYRPVAAFKSLRFALLYGVLYGNSFKTRRQFHKYVNLYKYFIVPNQKFWKMVLDVNLFVSFWKWEALQQS